MCANTVCGHLVIITFRCFIGYNKSSVTFLSNTCILVINHDVILKRYTRVTNTYDWKVFSFAYHIRNFQIRLSLPREIDVYHLQLFRRLTLFAGLNNNANPFVLHLNGDLYTGHLQLQRQQTTSTDWTVVLHRCADSVQKRRSDF